MTRLPGGCVQTADGKVHVFDLAQNKNEPICEQKMPSKKAKLTRIAFNPKQPVLLVGDEKGRVTLLKLSPNLRKTASPVEGKSQQECEEAKMDRIIQIAEKSLKQALKVTISHQHGRLQQGLSRFECTAMDGGLAWLVRVGRVSSECDTKLFGRLFAGGKDAGG